jgi:uncharacterized membrane protein
VNAAHLHLLLNHVPVLGVLFGLGLAVAALVGRSGAVAKASFGVFLAVAVLSLPAYLTGEAAEKVVERLPCAAPALIEPHQEAALLAIIPVELLGLLSLGALVLFQRARSVPRWLVTTVFVLSLVAGALMARAALLGGRIHHEEVRPGFHPPAAAEAAPEAAPPAPGRAGA